jgi:hypothetical protein
MVEFVPGEARILIFICSGARRKQRLTWEGDNHPSCCSFLMVAGMAITKNYVKAWSNNEIVEALPDIFPDG